MAAVANVVLRGAVALASLLCSTSAMHGRGRQANISEYLSTAVKYEMETTLSRALPMKWLHVPRSGSSFLNILTHHEGICPDFPQEVILVRPEEAVEGHIPGGVQALMAEDPALRVEAVHGSFWNYTGFTRFCHDKLLPEGHSAIGGPWSAFKQYSGKLVTMMRQPEQRLLSAYDYAKMGCPDCQNEIEFAQKVAGCVTKMLASSSARVGAPCLTTTPKPTLFDTKKAQDRMENDFAFIGLVEEWELSICLFHTMFGGECHKVEFLDVHPGISVGNANISRLGGFTDPYDGPLYEIAKYHFWSKVAEHKLTYARCRDMCR